MIEIEKKTLHFKQPAGTSRGIYTTRTSWFVTIIDSEDKEHFGIGECAPLPKLSCDAVEGYELVLRHACDIFEKERAIPYDLLENFPSILFGLETAIQHYENHSFAFFDTPFSHGKQKIPINGLVWMGNRNEMLQRINEKLQQGFNCIKLKIGALDFIQELELIKSIRDNFGKSEIEVRLDANGAFSPKDAMKKLEILSRFDIHSIEQPIPPGMWEEMRNICAESPIPIAFDEELIGINTLDKKKKLLDTLRPSYIVIKPSLHGGMTGTQEWLEIAKQRDIANWITSALESNIGLNSIAQLTAKVYGKDISMHQGLGTGALFIDNIELPYSLDVSEGFLSISL